MPARTKDARPEGGHNARQPRQTFKRADLQARPSSGRFRVSSLPTGYVASLSFSRACRCSERPSKIDIVGNANEIRMGPPAPPRRSRRLCLRHSASAVVVRALCGDADVPRAVSTAGLSLMRWRSKSTSDSYDGRRMTRLNSCGTSTRSSRHRCWRSCLKSRTNSARSSRCSLDPVARQREPRHFLVVERSAS